MKKPAFYSGRLVTHQLGEEPCPSSVFGFLPLLPLNQEPPSTTPADLHRFLVRPAEGLEPEPYFVLQGSEVSGGKKKSALEMFRSVLKDFLQKAHVTNVSAWMLPSCFWKAWRILFLLEVDRA